MNLNIDVTATVAQEEQENSGIPSGRYLVRCTKTEMKDTRNKTGKGLINTWTILSADDRNLKGKTFRTWWNVINDNPKAETIGRREASACAKACGMAVIQNSNDFLDQQVIAHLVNRGNQDGFGPSYHVKKWEAYGSAASANLQKFTPPPTPAPMPSSSLDTMDDDIPF